VTTSPGARRWFAVLLRAICQNQTSLKSGQNHLAKAYAVPLEKVEAELQEQHAAIENFSNHEEVVLWFEHDLFCQVHLIYLLDWFAQRDLGNTRLTLISIDEFPGVKCFMAWAN
jgi:hypothetical protein